MEKHCDMKTRQDYVLQTYQEKEFCVIIIKEFIIMEKEEILIAKEIIEKETKKNKREQVCFEEL